MYCNKCGFKNDKDSLFCVNCGFHFLTDENKKTNADEVLFIPEKRDKTWRNIGLVIIVVFVLLAILFSQTNNNSTHDQQANTTSFEVKPTSTKDWQTFTSVEHKFKINFPQYPSTDRISPKTIKGIIYSGTIYSAETIDRNEFYIVQAADYDIQPNNYDNKTGLEGMLNGMTNNGSLTITSSKFATFRGYDALEFDGNFYDSGKTYYTKGIEIVRNDMDKIKAYVLWSSSIDKNLYIENYQNFINSFEVTN